MESPAFPQLRKHAFVFRVQSNPVGQNTRQAGFAPLLVLFVVCSFAAMKRQVTYHEATFASVVPAKILHVDTIV
jgi:hypothetical protein